MQKSACNENVRSFIETLTWEDLYFSVITTGELSYGIEKLPYGKKKHDLSIWLYTKLPDWFNRRIIEIDSEVMLEWGKIRARTKKTLTFADSIIAASSIVHHMFIVTRNVKDFDEIDGINLINPWEF
jgi:predicted nucleic acid-binding protein